jgi:hypothetical protein
MSAAGAHQRPSGGFGVAEALVGGDLDQRARARRSAPRRPLALARRSAGGGDTVATRPCSGLVHGG